MKKLFYIALLIVIVYLWLNDRAITHGPGVTAPDKPRQVDLADAMPLSCGDYTIYPLAKFNITARVLSKRKYSFGRASELSPLDLVLGWGPMSDETVLNKISIRQDYRWYTWSCKEFPITREEIERNSANMHLIPSSPKIKKDLKLIKKGHLVRISGYLVRVEGSDSWRWKSSLTRNDTGDGACELIWVEDLYIL